MAISIPGVGEGLSKFVTRTFTFGTATASPDVSVTTGTGLTTLVNINEANVFVKSFDLQVIEVLATAGTAANTIGDSDDADGYWTDTLANLAATAAVFANMATSVAYAGGRLYTVTDVISLTRGTAGAKKGLVKARIQYMRNADTNLNPATST